MGVAGDNLKLGGKYLTAGVESGLGNGFKAIVRGSVADGTMQAGPLKIGTSFGNLDTGVSGDISGLEAKLLETVPRLRATSWNSASTTCVDQWIHHPSPVFSPAPAVMQKPLPAYDLILSISCKHGDKI